jgi:FAD/FMN-containing dehydrogenase
MTHRIKALFYRVTADYRGSISAEHGIGIDKREYLHYSRSKSEIALMTAVKRALDPKNILSPGRIFDISDDVAVPYLDQLK